MPPLSDGTGGLLSGHTASCPVEDQPRRQSTSQGNVGEKTPMWKPPAPSLFSTGDPTTFPVPGFSPSFCVGSGDPATFLVSEAFQRLKTSTQQPMRVAALLRNLPTRPFSGSRASKCPLLPDPGHSRARDKHYKEASQDVFRASGICERSRATRGWSCPHLPFGSKECSEKLPSTQECRAPLESCTRGIS